MRHDARYPTHELRANITRIYAFYSLSIRLRAAGVGSWKSRSRKWYRSLSEAWTKAGRCISSTSSDSEQTDARPNKCSRTTAYSWKRKIKEESHTLFLTKLSACSFSCSNSVFSCCFSLSALHAHARTRTQHYKVNKIIKFTVLQNIHENLHNLVNKFKIMSS
jgi:hypothetical protein